jgi:hypothetical protein
MRMDVESEIRDLKRRVGEIEGTYGFLSGQVREVHRAVLGFQEQTGERFERVEERFDALEGRTGRLESRLERFEARTEQQLDALPRALAEIVRAEFARRDREGG